MAIKIQPKTAAELNKIDEKSQSSFKPWPNGTYDFEVFSASEKVSKASGNGMIELRLDVYNDQGSRRVIFDYLVPGTDFGDAKIAHAYEAIGMKKQYESGELSANDFEGKRGKVSLRTQKGTKDYPEPKNVVSSYVKSGEGTDDAWEPQKNKAKGKTLNDDLSDDVPF